MRPLGAHPVPISKKQRAAGVRKLSKLRAKVVADLSERLQNAIRTAARTQALLAPVHSVRRRARETLDAALGRPNYRARRAARGGHDPVALLREASKLGEAAWAARRTKAPPLPPLEAANVELLCITVPVFVKAHPVFTRAQFVKWVRKHERKDPVGLSALAEAVFPATRGGRAAPSERAVTETDRWQRRVLRPSGILVFWMLLTARAELQLSIQEAAEEVGERLGCGTRTVFELLAKTEVGPPARKLFEAFLREMPGGEGDDEPDDPN
jgi:hypothetical protein